MRDRPLSGEAQAFPGIWGALGLIAATLLAQVLVVSCLQKWELVAADSPRVQALVIAIVLANGIVTAAFLARRGLGYRDVLHPATVSARATVALLAIPVVLVTPAVYFATAFANALVVAWFPMAEWQLRMFAELLDGDLASLLGVAVVAPFFEELLFRGIVLRGLLARMAPARAIVLSAVIFGAAHLNLYQFVTGILMGLPLGWLYWRFRSTWPGVVMHSAFNSIALAVAGLQRGDPNDFDFPLWVLLAAVGACIAGTKMLASLARLRQSAQ